MTLRASAGMGRYASGETDVFYGTVAAWNRPGTVTGVIYLHGHGMGAAGVRGFTSTGERALLDAIAAEFPVLIPDAGGVATWGNATSVARTADARTYLQGSWGAKAGRVLLVGASMGATVALNFARANPGLVAAVAAIIPAVDLGDVVTNNRGGHAASVNAAYGGAYVEAVHGPTSNPVSYAAGMTRPVRLWTASDDPICLPARSDAFVAACPGATQASVGALGHSQAAIGAVPTSDLLAFLRANAA